MKLNDVLFGEPEYDNEGNVIKRNMGLKNVLVWIFLFYVFQNYSFIGSKQKGGLSEPGKGQELTPAEVTYAAIKSAVARGGVERLSVSLAQTYAPPPYPPPQVSEESGSWVAPAIALAIAVLAGIAAIVLVGFAPEPEPYENF